MYDSDRGVVGKWSLQANGHNNGGATDCVSTPIRFLVPSESVCSTDMSDGSACAAARETYLDPMSYVEDAAPFVPTEVGSQEFASVVTRDAILACREFHNSQYTQISGRGHSVWVDIKIRDILSCPFV